MRSAALVLLVMFMASCGDSSTREPATTRATHPTASIDEATLRGASARPQDWLTYGLTYAEQRFSPLDQINERTVERLGPAWSFDTGTDRGLEATPLVVDGVLYTTGSWSIVFAVDARTGKLLWKWDPKVAQAEYGAKACCDVVNRGVAVYRGRVYVGVLDGRLAALDAATGAVAWEIVTVDRSKPYVITGAPRIVKGQVIIGNSGADMGVRGYVSAYDTETGALRWRFYTVPGDPSKPFESAAMAKAAATWKGRWWEIGGGGTAWDAIAFDPDLDLLYVGTGNGSPWNRHVRSPGGGDNLYLASILALDPDDGRLVWYYQTTPGDTWDYTATQHIMLADLEIAGRRRQVLMQAPKNGFFYVLDRRTGELISAAPIVKQTWTTGIDPSGRPIEAPGADYRDRPAHISPGTLGAHNWQPMSYNPSTGLVYIPAQENARYFEQDPHFDYRPTMETMVTGTYPAAGILPEKVPLALLKERSYAGHLLAWDPVAQRARWRVTYPTYWNGGTLSTAGNLVFQGTAAGTLAAYRATDGQKLWEQWAGASVMAPPVTYLVDGIQHVSVMVGFGGGFGRGARRPGKLLTFKLGGTATLPDRPVREQVRAIHQTASPRTIARGGALFEMYCARCHGGGTTLADLRYSPEGVFGIYEDIVLKGTMVDAGMRAFGNVLGKTEALAIRAWVIAERRKIATTTE